MSAENPLGGVIQEIEPQKINAFLRSGSFAKPFNSMISRAKDYEQGLAVCSSEDHKNLKVLEFKTVGLEEVFLDYGRLRKKKLIPLLGVHIHPIEELSEAYSEMSNVPSDDDLAVPPENWDEITVVRSASALIVASHPLKAWLWQRPRENQLNHILKEYKYWYDSLKGRLTDRDIGDLKTALIQAGLKLVTGDLDAKNPARSFGGLFEGSGIKMGFGTNFG